MSEYLLPFVEIRGKLWKYYIIMVCNAYIIWRFEVYAFTYILCRYHHHTHIYNRFEREREEEHFRNDLMFFFSSFGWQSVALNMKWVSFYYGVRFIRTRLSAIPKWTIHSSQTARCETNDIPARTSIHIILLRVHVETWEDKL